MRGNSYQDLEREVVYGRRNSDPPAGPPLPGPGDKYVVFGFIIGTILGGVVGAVLGRFVSNYVTIIPAAFVGAVAGTLVGDRLRKRVRGSGLKPPLAT